MSYYHSQQRQHQDGEQLEQQPQHQRKKKVEWSSTLSSSQSQPVENKSPMWDSEAGKYFFVTKNRLPGFPHDQAPVINHLQTCPKHYLILVFFYFCPIKDHMLSYFLDSNGVASPPATSHFVPYNNGGEYASLVASDQNNTRLSVSDRILQHPFRSNFSGSASANVRQDQLLGLKDDGGRHDNIDNDIQQPPPTPVIQHYFPSSSSSVRNIPKSSSGGSSTTGSSEKTSGIRLPRNTGQFSFGQQQQQQQQQPRLKHPAQKKQQPLNPSDVMSQNFLGVLDQQFTRTSNVGNSNESNFSFQEYAASMEGASPVSPALEFGGDHEPMLLPPGRKDAQDVTVQQSEKTKSYVEAMAARINALTESYIQNISTKNSNPILLQSASSESNKKSEEHVNIPKGPVAFLASASIQPGIQSQLEQAVAATQKQFAESVPSNPSLTTNTYVAPTSVALQPNVTIPIHPIAAAALAGSTTNHQYFFPNFTAAYLMQKAESAEETEEKRAKRLERNRASARKSRRRKKERLSNLEAKVNVMYAKVERERRVRINLMNDASKRAEKDRILDLKERYFVSGRGQDVNHSEEIKESLSHIFIDETEQSMRKDVVEFQYNFLSQNLLARYQKYWLWVILQSDLYYLQGKEKHSKRIQTKKITTGKISSKQIGEEISKEEDNGSGNHTASASDASRFWPLVCFELSISVEQEDRILEARKR